MVHANVHRTARAGGRASAGGGQSHEHRLLELQRAAGNRAVTGLLEPVVQRVPYANTYTESQARSALNASEGRNSPVNAAPGHPRQHAGRVGKAIAVAEDQNKTKSVFANTAAQDKATASVLTSAAGQAAMAALDNAAPHPGPVLPGAAPLPAVPTRVVMNDQPCAGVDIFVARAKKKKGAGAAAAAADTTWVYSTSVATQATVIVDSMGTGADRDIHIQTAFPTG